MYVCVVLGENDELRRRHHLLRSPPAHIARFVARFVTYTE
jgi:hypothetical protein